MAFNEVSARSINIHNPTVCWLLVLSKILAPMNHNTILIDQEEDNVGPKGRELFDHHIHYYFFLRVFFPLFGNENLRRRSGLGLGRNSYAQSKTFIYGDRPWDGWLDMISLEQIVRIE